jgi:hypothetical protein
MTCRAVTESGQKPNLYNFVNQDPVKNFQSESAEKFSINAWVKRKIKVRLKIFTLEKTSIRTNCMNRSGLARMILHEISLFGIRNIPDFRSAPNFR